jgi:subtilisin family serine protease
MKLLVKDYLNIRTRNPRIEDNNNPSYYSPGDEIEVVETLLGESLDNNPVWFKLSNSNYVWSGGTVNSFPWWISELGIEELWAHSKGEGVTVFLLDSGISETDDLANENITVHSTLNDNGVDQFGHGTLMASIVAGTGNHILGIAPKCNIVAIKICSGEVVTETNLINGLTRISELITPNKSYVVNCSLALPLDISEANKSTIQTLINRISQSCVIISAVGNVNLSLQTIPASLENVISVAGLRMEDGIFVRLGSNYWPDIAITAPGQFPVSHLTSFPNLRKQGSSHACAFTTGIVALMLSTARKRRNSLPVHKVATMIREASEVVSDEGKIYRVFRKDKLKKIFQSI